jgi:hypothetical protein
VWFDSQIYISNFRKKTKELENLIQKKNILSIIKKHFSNPDQKLEWVDYFSKTNYLQDDQNTCCLIPFSRLDIQDECNFASDEILIDLGGTGIAYDKATSPQDVLTAVAATGLLETKIIANKVPTA